MKLTKIVLSIACALPVTAANAAVIYRETFGRPENTGDLHLSLADWADFSSNGTWVTAAGTANFGLNGSANGRPIDVANVNAGTNTDGSAGALPRGIHFFLAAGGGPALSVTPEYAFNPAGYQSLSFSWYAANASAADTMRLAVQVGGNWYVGAQQFSTAALGLAAFAGSAELKTVNYNPAPANWLTLNFNGSFDTGTDLGTDSAAALSLGAAPGAPLSGMVTAFGVYLDSAVGTRRFDTFEINAEVPEPAALLLMGVAALGLALARRW